MTARRTLTLSILIVTATLAFTGQTLAKWTEVQNGTTYECENVKKTKCIIHRDGTQTCEDIQSVKCKAIKGPGSGQALTTDWDQPPQPTPPKLVHFNKNAVLATF